MTLYRLEFSSYDGCMGWSSWYGEEVFTDIEKAKEECAKRETTYVRCDVNEFETKD